MARVKCKRCRREYGEEARTALVRVRVSGGLTVPVCRDGCEGTDFRPAPTQFVSAPGEPGLPRCSQCSLLISTMEKGCPVHGISGISETSRRTVELMRR